MLFWLAAMKEQNGNGNGNGLNENNYNYNNVLAVSKIGSKMGKGGRRSNSSSIAKTPVYTIDKSEFRNTVQMLTGSHSPSIDVNQISDESSRPRQNRPPPLPGFMPPLARASNPGPPNGISLAPISMQFPFPTALDAFWFNLAVNSRQEAQNLPASHTGPSIWVDNNPSLDRNSLPAIPSPGSRCLPSPSFLSPLPSPSGLPKDIFSRSPPSFPHGHMYQP